MVISSAIIGLRSRHGQGVGGLPFPLIVSSAAAHSFVHRGRIPAAAKDRWPDNRPALLRPRSAYVECGSLLSLLARELAPGRFATVSARRDQPHNRWQQAPVSEAGAV